MENGPNNLSSRKRMQEFWHQFDWYANPVTLTYDQKKSFTTVPGAVCSIVSGALLLYYILLNVSLFWEEDKWFSS